MTTTDHAFCSHVLEGETPEVCGGAIVGTLERLSGVALANLSHNACGAVDVDHQGETEIWWDEQRTVTRDGETVFVCEHGHEVKASEILWQSAEDAAA